MAVRSRTEELARLVVTARRAGVEWPSSDGGPSTLLLRLHPTAASFDAATGPASLSSMELSGQRPVTGGWVITQRKQRANEQRARLLSVARATLEGLRDMGGRFAGLTVEDVGVVRARDEGDVSHVQVTVVEVTPTERVWRLGTAPVDEDLEEAAMRATLNAMERR